MLELTAPAKVKIDPMHKRFCNYYLVDFNGADAIIKAGYKTTRLAASVYANTILKKPNVQFYLIERVYELTKGIEITVQRVLREAARIAFSDARNLFDEKGNLKSPKDWDDNTAASVASVEVFEEYEGKGEAREFIGYTKKVKLWNKTHAIELLMKYLKLLQPDHVNDDEEDVVPVVEMPPILIQNNTQIIINNPPTNGANGNNGAH